MVDTESGEHRPATVPDGIMVKNPWGCLGMITLGMIMGLLLLVATCSRLNDHSSATADTAPSNAIYKAAAEKLVRRQLRDPESAIFSEVYVVGPNADGDAVVCGAVNSKNGFGGMAGSQRFIAGPTVILKGPNEVFLEERVGKELMDLEWAKTC